MSWYKIGTIATINGSKIITGAGTQFTNPLNGVSAGRMLLLPAAGTVQIYEIESVQSDTQLTLVSAYSGTTGSGKLYAIPTSPAVSIEQFAHEFASTLAYYQQQLQGWQSILTGSGNIILTTPDGQSVTVRSQTEWDRLLDTKMGAGQFGWGGAAKTVTGNLGDFFGTNAAPSGLYQCDSSQVTGLPDGFGPSILEWHYPSPGYGVLYAADVTSRGKYAVQLLRGGEWQGWGTEWNSHNLSPVTLDTIQTITNAKIFKYGDRPLTLVASNSGGPIYIPFYDSNGTTRKGWIGKGSSNDAIQIQNDATSASITLAPNGDINLSTSGAGTVNWNGNKVLMSATEQTISSLKIFTVNPSISRAGFPGIEITNTNVANGTVGRYRLITSSTATQLQIYSRSDGSNTTGQVVTTIPTNATGTVLVSGNNAVADSSGFWKTASPVINIYSDGSFTTTDEAEGVNVERLSEGVYKITGCQGMHSDAAWSGIDGGVSNPKCRNDKALLWNNYEVAEDGSVTVYTFHRVHPDAMPFAQNRLTLDKEPFDPENGHTPDMEWPDQTPIDVPRGLFIQVRVNMPEPEPVKPAVMSSNVCCNTISPA
ncbi:hypothetical protein ACS91J_10835 [Pectobacterium carotovorum]